MKAQTLQQRFEFGDMPLVRMVNPSDFRRILIPFLQDFFRWQLLSEEPMDTIIQDAHQACWRAI